jgi:hypothetical protein
MTSASCFAFSAPSFANVSFCFLSSVSVAPEAGLKLSRGGRVPHGERDNGQRRKVMKAETSTHLRRESSSSIKTSFALARICRSNDGVRLANLGSVSAMPME